MFGDFEVRVQLARERYAALLREAEIARRLADRLDPGGRALIPETVAGER